MKFSQTVRLETDEAKISTAEKDKNKLRQQI